jgi:hypothetical protein
MTDMEDKRAHLTMIQAVISRMAGNSFLLKGWAVTVTAGVAALASNKDDHRFVFIALLPTLVMWPLNGYFLCQERRFRKLYDQVRLLPQDQIDYSMKPSGRPLSNISWLKCTFSKTLNMFYGTQLVFVLVTVTMLFG